MSEIARMQALHVSYGLFLFKDCSRVSYFIGIEANAEMFIFVTAIDTGFYREPSPMPKCRICCSRI